MNFLKDSMSLPVDNLLGMLLYAILYMLVVAIIVGLALKFIPNSLSYTVKNAIMGIAIFISLYVWWVTIIN